MIRLREVTKEYSGPHRLLAGHRVRALDGVSLEVPPGAALALVGPNGAGKSTLIRLLLGYARPTSGTVEIDGMEPRRYVERHGVSYVPEHPEIRPLWTVRGALRVFTALGEVPHHEDRIDAVLARLGLEEQADRRVGTLSRGALQRLALAQALLGRRRMMVLDEPTNGLDPEWTVHLRGIVRGWRRADPQRVLVMASHDLDEVERMADVVAVLRGGRVVETIDLRAARAVDAYRLEVVDAPSAAAAVHAAFPGAAPVPGDAVTTDGAGGRTLAFRVPADADAVARGLPSLVAAGVAVRALVPLRPTLAMRLGLDAIVDTGEDV